MRVRIVLALLAASLAGCDWDLQRMVDQARCEPDEICPAFESGVTNQQPPAGVVPWRPPGSPATPPPEAIDRALIERGRDRFDIFCAACHGRLGNGRSEVAENMALRPPTSLVTEVAATWPDARIESAIARGFGLMPSYAHALPPRDRAAVVAYVRALQLSQRVRLADLPPVVQQEARQWVR